MSQAQISIEEVCASVERMTEKYQGVLAYFGEDPDTSSQEFFSTLEKFVSVRRFIEYCRWLNFSLSLTGFCGGERHCGQTTQSGRKEIPTDAKFNSRSGTQAFICSCFKLCTPDYINSCNLRMY